MNKLPKYSVGCEVVYNSDSNKLSYGYVYRIAEVGRGCFYYTLMCENGKKHSMYEANIIRQNE